MAQERNKKRSLDWLLFVALSWMLLHQKSRFPQCLHQALERLLIPTL